MRVVGERRHRHVLVICWFVDGCGIVGTSVSPETPAGLVVDVTISAGKATPTNASYDASVNEPITFRVTSDTEDELHVHSTPDHEFEIKAAPNQAFDFTVGLPGRVDVELHHLNVVLATIDVR